MSYFFFKWFIQSFLCIKDGDELSTFSGFDELLSEKEHNDAYEPRVEFNGFSVLEY